MAARVVRVVLRCTACGDIVASGDFDKLRSLSPLLRFHGVDAGSLNLMLDNQAHRIDVQCVRCRPLTNGQ